MLQNIPKEKVLEVVKQGPTFPAKVAKQLGMGGDTVLVGAILSTLISTGEVKVSTIKIGGSPLYYLPEQESRLEEFIDHLNDKDRKTLKLLKEQKVLQDDLQDPLIRVSLRAIKDFAKHFDITIQGQRFSFWRFYTEPLEDAESLAKKVLRTKSSESSEAESKTESRSGIVSTATSASISVPASAITSTTSSYESQMNVSASTHEIISAAGPVAENRTAETIHSAQASPKTHSEVHPDVHPDAQTLLEDSKEARPHVHIQEHDHTHAAKHEHHESHHESPQPHHVEHHDVTKARSHHVKDTKPKEPKAKALTYDFLEVVKKHLAAQALDILSTEKIKKTEYNMILKNHDANEYIYCKAKDKSGVSEGDLAPALIFAQSKKMPCLFISTGMLTKNAEQMMNAELKGLKFERILVSQ